MTDNYLHNEADRLVKACPIYLGVQGATLLLTFLESPVYMEAYQKNHMMSVTGWAIVWFLLFIFGLTLGTILLISRTWKMALSFPERGKLAAGYLLGAIAGLLTLGLRFMAIMPAQFFYLVGGLVLLFSIVYLIWTRRQSQSDEIFP